MYDAIRIARSRQVQVLVATPPYLLGEALHAAHVGQQREMAEMIDRNFGSDRDVLYVNLGQSVDLSDPAMSFDRMHLTAEGNARIAAALTEPVIRLRERRVCVSASASSPSPVRGCSTRTAASD